MKKGDTGDAVRVLQHQLNQSGFKIEADGWFGDTTEAAVKAFQRRLGLVEDGIAGIKTLALLKSGMSDPRLLSHADLERAAQRLDVPVACVCAVNEVESRGHGFLPDGRPVILFERHVMYERLRLHGLDADALFNLYPAVVNTARGGYVGGVAEYQRMALAISVDASCAAESASWGLFQIMGYHWERLGYASVDAFADAMIESEAQQLDTFVRFVEADPELHKALKGKKWADFAKRYNGASYKENLYDVKLARAFDRHSTEGAAA